MPPRHADAVGDLIEWFDPAPDDVLVEMERRGGRASRAAPTGTESPMPASAQKRV